MGPPQIPSPGDWGDCDSSSPSDTASRSPRGKFTSRSRRRAVDKPEVSMDGSYVIYEPHPEVFIDGFYYAVPPPHPDRIDRSPSRRPRVFREKNNAIDKRRIPSVPPLGATPFVGRAMEFGILHQHLHRIFMQPSVREAEPMIFGVQDNKISNLLIVHGLVGVG
jgi:hypothetical protein